MSTSRGALLVVVAGMAFTATAVRSALAASAPPRACATTKLTLTDVGDNLDALWIGNEVPATGKRLGTQPTIPLTFNMPVSTVALQHALTLVGQVPTAGGQQIPCTPGTTGLPLTPHYVTPYYAPPEAAWGMTTSTLPGQAYPRDFSVFVFGSVSGLQSVGGPVAAQGSVTLSNMSIDYSIPNAVAIVSGASVQAAPALSWAPSTTRPRST